MQRGKMRRERVRERRKEKVKVKVKGEEESESGWKTYFKVIMSLLMMKQEQLVKKSMHANKAQPGREERQ